MDKKMKETFVKQMLLPKEELALQTMELMADKMDLQQRIEKAVEYIEKCRNYHINCHNDEKIYPDEIISLLMILKGDDINE